MALNDVLSNQVNEKRMREENDKRTNKTYMQNQLQRTEDESNRVREIEK